MIALYLYINIVVIKKIISFFLLLVFAFAIIPAFYIHHHSSEKVVKNTSSGDQSIDHENEVCKICKAFCAKVFTNPANHLVISISFVYRSFDSQKIVFQNIPCNSFRNKAPPLG